MIEIEEITERVIEMVVCITGIPREEIHAQLTFDELDLDSLSRIELLVDLEREFDVQSEPAENEENEDMLSQILSVKDAVDLIAKNLKAKEAA